MFLYLWDMRQEREFLAHRAVIQAIMGSNNQEAVQASYKDLLNAFNPYLKETKEHESKKYKEKLAKEIAKGTLSVVPINNPFSAATLNAYRRTKQAIKEKLDQPNILSRKRNRDAANSNRNG